MAEARLYQPVFSHLAAEFILQLNRRNRRRVMDMAYQLASDPFVKADYAISDADGRAIEHLASEEYVLMYWVDHAARLVMIIEIAASR